MIHLLMLVPLYFQDKTCIEPMMNSIDIIIFVLEDMEELQAASTLASGCHTMKSPSSASHLRAGVVLLHDREVSRKTYQATNKICVDCI